MHQIEQVTLSDAQMENIAELASEKVMQKLYARAGKGAVDRLAWVLVACIVGILLWMGSKGIMPK